MKKELTKKDLNNVVGGAERIHQIQTHRAKLLAQQKSVEQQDNGVYGHDVVCAKKATPILLLDAKEIVAADELAKLID